MFVRETKTESFFDPAKNAVLTYISPETDKVPYRVFILVVADEPPPLGPAGATTVLAAIFNTLYLDRTLYSIPESLKKSLAAANDKLLAMIQGKAIINRGFKALILILRRNRADWITAGDLVLSYLPRGDRKKHGKDKLVVLAGREGSTPGNLLGMSHAIKASPGSTAISQPGLFLLCTPELVDLPDMPEFEEIRAGKPLSTVSFAGLKSIASPGKGSEATAVIAIDHDPGPALTPRKRKRRPTAGRRTNLTRFVPALLLLIAAGLASWSAFKYFSHRLQTRPEETGLETAVTDTTGEAAPQLAPKPPAEAPVTTRIAANKQLTPLWHLNAQNSITSSATSSDSLIFFGSRDRFLYAVNFLSGRVKWKFPAGGGIGSSPAVEGNLLTFGSYDGFIYTINLIKSRLEWRYRTRDEVRASPLIYDGRVFIGSNDWNMRAFDLETGEVLWTFKTGNRVWSTPAVWNDRLCFGSFDTYLYCLNHRTGELIWRFRTNGRIYSSPCISGDMVYFGSTDWSVYALKLDTGKLAWSHKTAGPVYSSPKVTGESLVIGSNDNSVYSFDLATGKLNWRTLLQGNVYSSPTIWRGVIFVTCYDRNLYALRSDNGEIMYKVRASGKIYATPLVYRGNVYFGDFSGRFHAFKINTGS